MLLNKNSPLVIDWLYVLTHLPWIIRFLRNCTSARVDHIAKSLSSFSSQATLAYKEIFNAVDMSKIIVHKEPIFLYESKELFEKNQYIFNLRKKYNVQFDIINAKDIAKIEPSLAPIYYKGIALRGEIFTRSPLQVTQKIFDNFINNGGDFIISKIDSIYNNSNSLFLRSSRKEQQFDKIDK